MTSMRVLSRTRRSVKFNELHSHLHHLHRRPTLKKIHYSTYTLRPVEFTNAASWKETRRKFDEIIDVRSPSEWLEDHIPNAINLPVLSDEERAQVGTLYKSGKHAAKLLGAKLIMKNISTIIDTHISKKPSNYKPLIYCWRGGKRSGSLAIVLQQIGFPATVIANGYKSWRKMVRSELVCLPKNFDFRVLRGPTGSGKSMILRRMEMKGHQVLDLEQLGKHKGSVLGCYYHTNEEQPSQKYFESLVIEKLLEFSPDRPVWVEGEGSKIGKLHTPRTLLEKIYNSPAFIVEVPLAERIAYILKDYAYITTDPERLAQQLNKLRRICGNAQVDGWLKLVYKAEFEQLVDSLLNTHYDRLSKKFLQTRKLNIVEQVPLSSFDDSSVDSFIEQITSMPIKR